MRFADLSGVLAQLVDVGDAPGGRSRYASRDYVIAVSSMKANQWWTLATHRPGSICVQVEYGIDRAQPSNLGTHGITRRDRDHRPERPGQ